MIYIKYNNGKRLRGILLSLAGEMIRVAIEGSGDAVEYRLVRGVWISEDCEVVRMEFDDRRVGEVESELPAVFAGEFGASTLHIM